MKRLSAQKKREVYNLLVEYFNDSELRYELGNTSNKLTDENYKEIVQQMNYLFNQIHHLAERIKQILWDKVTIRRYK